MKLVALTVAAVTLLAIGCNKSAPQPPPDRAGPATPAPTNAVVAPATAIAPAIVSAPTQVTATATAAVIVPPTNVSEATSNAVVARAQALIDLARKQVADGKLEQVAPTLMQLKDLPLTPAQEAQLLQLKDDLQKMVQDALKAR